MSAIEIPISQGLVTLISPQDEAVALASRWFVTEVSPGKRYAMRQEKEGGAKRTVYLHRRILGAEPGQMVDHINGDGLDNRRENLRFATTSQNVVNRRSYNPASGFRGVYAKGRRWQAMISVNGKNIRGGSFESKEAAARRYDELARLHFGEFAVLNFPSEGET